MFLLHGGNALAGPLSLREVIEATVASHPALQSQRRLVEGAQADVSTARQQFLPTPSVSVERINAQTADMIYRGNAAIQTYRLQQPLWTGGRLTAGVDKALAQEQASLAAAADARQQLTLRAVQAWSEWSSASLKLAAIEESVNTHQRLINQVSRRVDEGAAAPSELVLTQGRLAQTLSMLQATRAQLRSARSKVALLMGAPLGEVPAPGEALQFDATSLAELEAQALLNSPALQKLQAQRTAQEAEIRERRAELLPEVYVRAEHQRGQYDSASMSSVGVNRVYVGLASRFGAGLSNVTQLEALDKRLEAAQADAESVKRSLIEQVQLDFELWGSLKNRIPELTASLKASRATAEAWDRQFLAGRKSWLEVMNAARELMQAELDLVDAQVGLAQAKWRLSIVCFGVEKTLEQNPAGQPPTDTGGVVSQSKTS